MKINMIYMGEKYYVQSSTMLGVLYDELWNRQDWGKVAMYLREGHEVNIRHAYLCDIEKIEKMLEAYLKKLEE